jgi:hypothetical protein
MKKPGRLVMLLALPALLSACANGAVTVATNCNVGNHVSISKKDVLTEPTAQDIEANNRSREAGGCARPGTKT